MILVEMKTKIYIMHVACKFSNTLTVFVKNLIHCQVEFLVQLYALDQNFKVVSVNNAFKKQRYRCLECQKSLGMRGGLHRQKHFYHIDPSPDCRQNGKSEEHLNVQLFIEKKLPKGDVFLEKRFDEINRIADVVWLSKKIVFEVQCSFISYEEIKERNLDYAKIGYRVIWILHVKRFNKYRLTSPEAYLEYEPHYYTNMDAYGNGMIFDSFRLYQKGVRVFKTKPFEIDLSEFKKFNYKELNHRKKLLIPLKFLNKLKKQTIHFKGDLVDQVVINQDFESIFEGGMKFEKRNDFRSFSIIAKVFDHLIFRPYRIILQILLEKFSH